MITKAEPQATSQGKKKDVYYLHTLVYFLLIFGFGFLSPVAPITPMGMKIIGVFLGLLYGWTFLGQIWPSLFGLLALGLSGYMPIKQVFASSFGNDTVVMMIFIFTFSATIEVFGLSKLISLWFITRKAVMGKPWVFTFMFLLSVYILAALTSSSPAIVLGWGLLYSLCDVLGYKKGDKFPMLMIFAVVFSAQLGMSMLPFKAVPMIILSVFEGVAGYSVDYLQYMIYAFATGMICLLLIVAVGKYVFKPDVGLLKNVTAEIICGENEISLNKVQKIILGCLALLITLLMLPSLLPKQMFLSQFLNIIGPTGVVVMIVASMVLLKVEGKPLLNFRQMANVGISWDVIMLIAAVMPVSAALTSEATGFIDFLVKVLDPVLGGVAPGVFLFLVALIAVVFTNFCNNAATAVALLPVAYTYSLVLGINPVIPATMIVLCVHLAYLTPASSPSAALMHGNDWIDNKTIWQIGIIMAILAFLVVFILAMTLGNILFN